MFSNLILLFILIIIDIISSIIILLTLNYIAFKIKSSAYSSNYKIYNLYFIIAVQIISSLIILSLIFIFDLKLIGFIYLFFTNFIKSYRFRKFKIYILIILYT